MHLLSALIALTVSHVDGKVGGAILDHRGGRLKGSVRENLRGRKCKGAIAGKRYEPSSKQSKFMLFDIFCFALGITAPLILSTVMGPGQGQRGASSTPSARDPLHPPPFNGNGNPLQWARRVAKWERAHEALCRQKHKNGLPAYIRGYLLSEALSGTAYRTVESTIPEDVINSAGGVKAILDLLVKFNPTTYAHEIFTSFKALMQIRRKPKESFKRYVNRFEAAASELRGLTSQAADGEAEQFIAFQLLEGAQVPTAVFMQVLTNCIATTNCEQASGSSLTLGETMKELIELVERLKTDASDNFKTSLIEVDDKLVSAISDARRAEFEEVANKIASAQALLKERKLPSAVTNVEGFGVVTLDFESAKKALRGLDAVSLESSSGTTSSHSDSRADRGAIERIVRQTLLSQKGDQRNTESRSKIRANGQKRKTYAERIAERKARSKCKACGLNCRWAGDLQCKHLAQEQSGSMVSSAEGAAEDTPEEQPSKATESFFR